MIDGAHRADAIIRLGRIGYELGPGPDNPITVAAITAFQRHYRQSRPDGILDAETVALIRGLSRLVD